MADTTTAPPRPQTPIEQAVTSQPLTSTIKSHYPDQGIKCLLVNNIPTYTAADINQQGVATGDTLETVNEGYAACFILNNPEHLKEYQRIIDLVGKGLAQIEDRHVNYDSNYGCHVVTITWFEMHFEYGVDIRKRIYQSADGRVSFKRPWINNT